MGLAKNNKNIEHSTKNKIAYDTDKAELCIFHPMNLHFDPDFPLADTGHWWIFLTGQKAIISKSFRGQGTPQQFSHETL